LGVAGALPSVNLPPWPFVHETVHHEIEQLTEPQDQLVPDLSVVAGWPPSGENGLFQVIGFALPVARSSM
jgi:hypothetical protein